jgi:hypothetical protein
VRRVGQDQASECSRSRAECPIVDEVRISPRDDLAHAFDFLFASGLRKQHETLERLNDGGAHPQGRFWIPSSKVVGYWPLSIRFDG